MRERAKLIGGKLTVWTAPASGTEIELSVPAVQAYAASSAPWRSWFTEKFSSSARRSGNGQPSQSDSDSVDGWSSPIAFAATADAVRWHADFRRVYRRISGNSIPRSQVWSIASKMMARIQTGCCFD
jgi:hypothetical protein